MRLTTTSYAFLGLLVGGPHSAYELAEQMSRSFDYIWPRARSGLYQEPKRLVAAGFATVTAETRGRRRRAVYHATDAGRRAFDAWLDERPMPAAIEIEAVLRIMFADRGTKAQLLQALAQLREQGRTLQRRALQQGAGYADGHGTEHRIHLVATGGRFVHEYAALLERYATWAMGEVESWPSTGPDAAPRGRRILAEQLRLFG